MTNSPQSDILGGVGEPTGKKKQIMVLRRLQKIHNSYYFVLPKEYIRALSIRRGDYACITTDQDKIIIKKLKVQDTDMLPREAVR